MIDNMSRVHALDKGRCRHFGVLQVARRWAAMCLASDVLAVPLWLASELIRRMRLLGAMSGRGDVGRLVWSGRAPAPRVERETFLEKARLEPYGRPAVLEQQKFHRPAIEFALAHPPPIPTIAHKGARRGASLLERVAVGKRMRIDYEIRLDSFRSFLKENGLVTHTADDVDEALVLHMTDAYLEGRPSEFGCKILAATQWQNPAYGRHGSLSLPRTRLALQGWSKGAPPRQRLPMVWLKAAAVAADMVKNKQWCAAVCLLLIFDLYLRGGEVNPMLVIHHPHVRGRSRVEGRELRRRGGAGPPSQALLGRACGSLAQRARGCGATFPGVDALTFNAAFRVACKRLRLELVPYQTRHGGASADRAEKFRSLEEVRKRGKWHTESSTRRYEKHGKLQAKLAALPAALLSHMVYVEEHLEDIMKLKKAAPVPPELRLCRAL